MIKKTTLLLLLIVSIGLPGKAQLGIIVSQSVNKTKFTEATLLVKLNPDDINEVSVGPLFRKLNASEASIGHSQDYFGACLYGNVLLYKKLVVGLKIDFLYGDWWKAKSSNEVMRDGNYSSAKVKQGMEFTGAISAGYRLSRRIDLNVGYSRFTYDPKHFMATNNSAFRTNAYVLSVKYNIISNKNATAKEIHAKYF